MSGGHTGEAGVFVTKAASFAKDKMDQGTNSSIFFELRKKICRDSGKPEQKKVISRMIGKKDSGLDLFRPFPSGKQWGFIWNGKCS